jgi:signal transduction histidine kinase
MLGAKDVIAQRGASRQHADGFSRRYSGGHGSAVAPSAACLGVLASAAIAVLGPPVVRAVIEIGISLAALVGAWVLNARFRREAELHRTIADAAAAQERRRIARDLHDGLAQDLAFIAAHGHRIAREAGAEHPLAIAAQRALAVSRGAIAELSAPHAGTAGEALRRVAGELSSRFEINIEVHAEPLAVMAADREHIVRIAREAIVNAVRHGRARNVVVSLAAEDDKLVLRVHDDGVGIGATVAADGGGYGFLSMQERTAALGGALTAKGLACGGTELELVVPS